jgi:hypothetical protein
MWTRVWTAGLVAAGLAAGAATADVSGFLGSWFNSDSDKGGFLGTFVGSPSDASDIARIVTTAAGANHIRIHLYGRCTPECDWGSQVGRNQSASPDSDEVRSISADFNVGYGTKHLTLRQGTGNSLRFDVVTEFTDHSDRHDFESSGSLRFVPPPAVVAAEPSVPSAPSAMPAAAPLPAVAGATTDVGEEDCKSINYEEVYNVFVDGDWVLKEYRTTLINFGSNRAAAIRAQRVVDAYRFDEICFLKRPRAAMVYWRVAGQFPRDAVKGQDCDEVHPSAVEAKGGKVLDGAHELLDFGDDAASARQAASIIRTYRLNRQCFVARPDTRSSYWLAQ